MTFSDFKREAAKELKGIYYALQGHKYANKAIRLLRKDKEMSQAFATVARLYAKRSRETGGNWPKGSGSTE